MPAVAEDAPLGRATRGAHCAAPILAAMALLAAPGPARAVTVPPTIDADGSVDVTREIQRFVDSVPDGTTIRFPAHARYRIDGTLEWRDRRGITLDGNGAVLVATAHGDPYRAHLRLVDGRAWTIRRLRIRGANREGGQFDADYQWQHGIDLRGVDGARLDRVGISDVYGDAIYIGLSPITQRWSRGISIRDSTGVRTGRMAIAVTAGRQVRVDGGTWSRPGLSTFDIEPNGAPGGADRILIENAIIGPGSRHRALDIAGSGPVSNVTLRNSIFIGRALRVRVDEHLGRPRNIVVEHNVSWIPFKGPGAAMTFRNTDGVVVRGNMQVLDGGRTTVLIAAPGSTRVDRSRQPTLYRERSVSATMLQYAVGGAWLAAIALVACRIRAVPAPRSTRRRRS